MISGIGSSGFSQDMATLWSGRSRSFSPFARSGRATPRPQTRVSASFWKYLQDMSMSSALRSLPVLWA